MRRPGVCTDSRHGLGKEYYVTMPGVCFSRVGSWSQLFLCVSSVWLLRLGIAVIHGRPFHPQTRGKDERFHRTLKADLLAITTGLMKRSVWRYRVLFRRNHSGLNRSELFQQSPQRPLLPLINPNSCCILSLGTPVTYVSGLYSERRPYHRSNSYL